MNGFQTTASDGYLMATLRDYFFTNNFNFGQKASIVTSVVFESKAAFIIYYLVDLRHASI